MKKTLLAQVSGKVQGVWFRASTQEKAQHLGLTGYAHNLNNGDVEVKATGSEEGLESLVAYLNQGPRNAEVNSVQWEYVELCEFQSFTTA
ncbi:MAG: acylphosphatase [Pseudomonadales bacterium]|nr:acylphosphatase [Pseudomonadales bacterium]